jgi:hypothetical protein
MTHAEDVTKGKAHPKNGQIDLRSISLDPMGARIAEQTMERHNATLEKMSSPGALRLPPLLEEMRQRYGITDGFFKVQACFDRIHVFPIEGLVSGGDKFQEGGLIVKTERAQSADLMEAPRGIIISAGLSALDALRSNGIDLGHTIMLQRNAVYQPEVDRILGVSKRMRILIAGDISGSENLAQAYRDGKVQVKALASVDEKTGLTIYQHLFVDENGKTWVPGSTWTPADY